jgi:hypothetical protein
MAFSNSDDDIAFAGAATCKKKQKWTRLLIVDSQAVKNTCNASVESKGFCHYKCTNGIKRHLAVDTLGLPFFTHCTPANVSDDQGLIELLSNHLDYFRAKPVNIPKITILLDHGYHPDTITPALQKLYPQMMTKIRFELALKPTKAQKTAQGKTGFVPVVTRSVIERSHAWNNQSGWKHLLNNLRLVIQPLICFNWLKRWLEVFPIAPLEAGFKQLIHKMNQFTCPSVHYLNLQRIFSSA